MTIPTTHDNLLDLIAAYAVDAIDDAGEVAAIEQHLDTCAECRSELDRYREALAGLTPDLPAEQGSWERVRADIAADVTATDDSRPPTATVIAIPRRRVVGIAATATTLAAAAAVAVTVAVSGPGELGPAELTAPVVPATGIANLAGDVRLYDSSSARGRVVIDLRGVPDAPSGHHYEVWVLRPGATEMEAVGAFTPEDGAARLDLRLPGPGEYVAVDISIEPNDGPADHSGQSLGGAKLQ